MWDSKLFKAGVVVLLLFLIIQTGSQIAFIFRPLIIAVEVFFYAFLISGALYYAMVPLVDLLTGHKVPRFLAVIATYLIFIALITVLVILVGPTLQKEFTALMIVLPEKADQLLVFFESLNDTVFLGQLFAIEAISTDNLSEMIPNLINSFLNYALDSLTLILNFITSFFITIFVIPFLLYYMLMESGSGRIANVVNKLTPRLYAERTNRSLTDLNGQLASYVQGIGIVSVLIGILAYIGFLIIGVDYALVLAVFVAVTNVVPIIGPFIGAVPAVLIGAIDSPLMVLMVIIVIIVVQQLDSMLVRPQILGHKLAISPLAVIMVVLLAGRLWGLLGIILAVPIFTVIKIVATQVYETLQGGRREPERTG